MRRKTNVKYTKVDYDINPEKGTVKCTLNYDVLLTKYPLNDISINFNVINKILQPCNIKGIYIDNNNNIGIEMISIATSTCHNDDVFDEIKGKHIALTRAQAKAFEKTCRVYDLLCMKLDKTVQEMIRYIENNWNSAKKCWRHVLEIDDCGINLNEYDNNCYN